MPRSVTTLNAPTYRSLASTKRGLHLAGDQRVVGALRRACVAPITASSLTTRAHVLDARRRSARRRCLSGLARHLAGQQHLAVVAGDVDVAARRRRSRAARLTRLAARSPRPRAARRRCGGRSPPAHCRRPRRRASAARSRAACRQQSRGEQRQPTGGAARVSVTCHAGFPVLRAVGRRRRRRCSAARGCGLPGCARCARAARRCGRRFRAAARAILPPPRPVSAITVISRSCAASTAASTLAELPLVDSASSTSPAWPSARTCLEKMLVEVVVVADRGEDRGVGGQRDRRQLRAARARSGRRIRPRSAARRRPIRHCRRPAPCRRW